MERTPTIDVADDACPCCGLYVAEDWLAAVHPARECEVCIGFPHVEGPSCVNLHGDELRRATLHKVRHGTIPGWVGVAVVAADDAHRAGTLELRPAQPGSALPIRWWIDVPQPDRGAWERLARMDAVDEAIATTVSMFVGPRASRAPVAGDVRKELSKRLTTMSRLAGSAGIWRIEVAYDGVGFRLDIIPPSDYLEADTAAARRRGTIDHLAREAVLN